MAHGMFPKTVFILVLTSILAACGGDGGGGGGTILGPPAGSSDDQDAPVINLSLRAQDGTTDITSLEGTASGRLIAQVLDAENGDPVSGVVVSFASELGQISPATSTALSNGEGIAEVSLGGGINPGAGTASASATVNGEDVTSNAVGFETDGLGFGAESPNFILSPLDLTTEDGTPTISVTNEGTVTISITGLDGNAPTENVLVEFSATKGALTETAIFATDGVATTTLLAGTTTGSGLVSAVITIGSETLDSNSVTFISDGDGIATIVLSVPEVVVPVARASTPVDGIVSNTNSVEVTATVRNARGELVQGAAVQFQLEGDGRLSRMSDITNVSGVATTTILAGTTEGFGGLSATATVNGESVASAEENEVTFETAGDEPFTGEGNSNLTIVIGLDTNGSIIDGGETEISRDFPGILFARVTQADGNPSVESIVKFELIGGIGDLSPASGTALTDATGIASAALTAGTVPGAGTAKVSVVIENETFNSDTLTFSSLGDGGDQVVIIKTTFHDTTPGTPGNVITIIDPATITVVVEDDRGNKLSNRSAIVTTSLGTVSINGSTPGSTATGLTDTTGQFTIDLAAGTTLGDGTVVVTVGDTSEVVEFEVAVGGLQIGRCNGSAAPACAGVAVFSPGTILISPTTLSAEGKATVSLAAIDANRAAVPNIEITFSTNCSTSVPALADIATSAITNSNGIVEVSYTDMGCARLDTITATEASANLTASGDINVLDPTAGTMTNTSIVPENIQIQGTGVDSAQVTFQVLDDKGTAVTDAVVGFTLTNVVGGITLASASDLTDTSGNAIAVVNAGSVPAIVRVIANTSSDPANPAAPILETTSETLSINSGVPDQNSFSISATKLMIEGEGFDGETTSINVGLGDADNNAVVDGTLVLFTTEYGRVDSQCSTTNGTCSATLTSGAPKRPDDPGTPVQELGSSCPNPLISDETITILNGVAITDYVISSAHRLENDNGNTGTDTAVSFAYSVNAESSGIDCDEIVLTACDGTYRLSYDRAYLDEVGGTPGDNHHTVDSIPNPGQATAPFIARAGVPCSANFRAAVSDDVNFPLAPALTAQYNGSLGQLFGGRSSVMAYTQGEESFVDANRNGVYDFGETFIDLTDAFLDINEDEVFGNPTVAGSSGDGTGLNGNVAGTPECYGPVSPITDPTAVPDKCYQIGGDEEKLFDFTNDGAFNQGNGIYNGSLCPETVSSRPTACAGFPCSSTERYCTRDTVNIRREIVILMSGSGVASAIRDVLTGEYISSVDLSGATGPGFGLFDTASNVFTNTGAGPVAGSFTIGWGDAHIAPGVGETVSLTSGTSGVYVDTSDLFSGRFSSGTSYVMTVEGTTGCGILNSPDITPADSNATGPMGLIGISLGPLPTPAAGTSSIKTTVTTGKGLISTFSFSCKI
jgi:hypothetical protein